jgi:hypothetical protein
MWFLHTTGLLRHQGSQKKKIEGQTRSPKPKISKIYSFFPWFGSFGVSLIGKAIDLSLKAITATVEPYVGQMCNLVLWIQFLFFLLFQYQQG